MPVTLETTWPMTARFNPMPTVKTPSTVERVVGPEGAEALPLVRGTATVSPVTSPTRSGTIRKPPPTTR